MPRTPPKLGHAHVVFAFRTADNLRVEFDGQLTDAMTSRIFIDICRDQPDGEDDGIASAWSQP